MVMVKERECKETPLFPLLSLTSRTGGMMPYLSQQNKLSAGEKRERQKDLIKM